MPKKGAVIGRGLFQIEAGFHFRSVAEYFGGYPFFVSVGLGCMRRKSRPRQPNRQCSPLRPQQSDSVALLARPKTLPSRLRWLNNSACNSLMRKKGLRGNQTFAVSRSTESLTKWAARSQGRSWRPWQASYATYERFKYESGSRKGWRTDYFGAKSLDVLHDAGAVKDILNGVLARGCFDDSAWWKRPSATATPP